MSLSLNEFKLGFCSDTYLPFGPKSRFLLFFWRSSLRDIGSLGATHFCGGSIIDKEWILTTAYCCLNAVNYQSLTTNKFKVSSNEILNPIPLDILRCRAKTMPQRKYKWQEVLNLHPLKGNRGLKYVLYISKMRETDFDFYVFFVPGHILR